MMTHEHLSQASLAGIIGRRGEPHYAFGGITRRQQKIASSAMHPECVATQTHWCYNEEDSAATTKVQVHAGRGHCLWSLLGLSLMRLQAVAPRGCHAPNIGFHPQASMHEFDCQIVEKYQEI